MYHSYKGEVEQYTEDLKPFKVVVGDLTFGNEVTDLKNYKDVDGSNRNVAYTYYVLCIHGKQLIPFGTLTVGNGNVPVDEIRLRAPSELFQELPAKYKTEEGAKLLSQLFKEATKALQCTQDYTKWLANL